MSTAYYLKFLPEKDLSLNILKQVRQSLIEDHNLDRILELLKNEVNIETETVNVINKGVRGPYADGFYCGFVFVEEFAFWKAMVEKYPTNGLLNIIFAEYLVQNDKNYEGASVFYQKGFNIDFRLIGQIEPSRLAELTDNNFGFRLIYLKLQKEQYEPEDFVELVEGLKNKHKDDPDKIKQIETIIAR